MGTTLEVILTRVDQKWHKDLTSFISGHEASKEFFAFLDGSKECQAAVNLAFDSLASGLTGLREALRQPTAPASEDLKKEVLVSRLSDCVLEAVSSAPLEWPTLFREALGQAKVTAAGQINALGTDQREQVKTAISTLSKQLGGV